MGSDTVPRQLNVSIPSPRSFMRNQSLDPGLEVSWDWPSSCQPHKEVAAWLDSQEGPAGPSRETPTLGRLGGGKRKGVPRCVLETSPFPRGKSSTFTTAPPSQSQGDNRAGVTHLALRLEFTAPQAEPMGITAALEEKSEGRTLSLQPHVGLFSGPLILSDSGLWTLLWERPGFQARVPQLHLLPVLSVTRTGLHRYEPQFLHPQNGTSDTNLSEVLYLPGKCKQALHECLCSSFWKVLKALRASLRSA